MDVTIHQNKLEIDLFTNSEYRLKDGSISFTREIIPTSSGSRYNSYSSMVDNMYYQPSWVKNSYELGFGCSDTELISLGNSFYLFDRVPRGIKSIIYKNSGEKLIEVEFGPRDDGVVEYNFDQILLLKFEPDDTTSINKPSSIKIHEGIDETDGIGHKFHRAYNAIQFQDSDSVASKLLISAIFDTFDIDFSKGTLIGADSSKYFIGNRVKGSSASVPLLYEKVVNKIYDLEGCSISSLSEAEEKLELTVGHVVELENAGDISGYYKVLSGPTLMEMSNSEVPSVFPVYSNENTFCTSYIYGENVLSCSYSTFYYPPSSGALFEYSNGGCVNGCNMYYYVTSPMIDSGFNGIGEVSFNCSSFDESKHTPVVGTHLTESDEDHKISVPFFSKSLSTLDENESNWNYTKSGELIIDNNQLSKTYPMI